MWQGFGSSLPVAPTLQHSYQDSWGQDLGVQEEGQAPPEVCWQVGLPSVRHKGLTGRVFSVHQRLRGRYIFLSCPSDTFAPLAEVPTVTQLSDRARTPAWACQAPNPMPCAHKAGRGGDAWQNTRIFLSVNTVNFN